MVPHIQPYMTDPPSSVEVIEPGLVLLRNFVTDSECQKLAQIAMEIGQTGFYCTEKGGERVLNTGEARGRIYDAASCFPREVLTCCNEAVATCRSFDSSMPPMDCTHVLLNMYTTTEGLTWHRDIYENDGKSDHPVVNLCVGASCKFGVKHSDEDPERVFTLRSGDVLLFGGTCRLIKHAVLEILMDDFPKWMKGSPIRFSFTFRDSPEVLGREEEFKYFRVSEHLVGQNDFKVPRNSKTFRGLPALPSQSWREAHTRPGFDDSTWQFDRLPSWSESIREAL